MAFQQEQPAQEAKQNKTNIGRILGIGIFSSINFRRAWLFFGVIISGGEALIIPLEDNNLNNFFGEFISFLILNVGRRERQSYHFIFLTQSWPVPSTHPSLPRSTVGKRLQGERIPGVSHVVSIFSPTTTHFLQPPAYFPCRLSRENRWHVFLSKFA